MALQSSGAISIDDIVAEFGGTSPDGLDEYYRGGTYVPDITANNGVPTSGTISIEDFYGATNIVVEFDQASYTVSDVEATGVAIASIILNTDGTISITGNSSSPTSGTWAVGNVTGSDWEARLTVNSGTSPSGAATNTWLALSTGRAWSLTRAIAGIVTGNYTIEVRDAATSTLQDSCTVSMTAQLDAGGP